MNLSLSFEMHHNNRCCFQEGANYCTEETVCKFTAKFTTRITYQDTNKVYNQEKLPRYQNTNKGYTTRKTYQDTNKVYKIGTKIPTKCTTRKTCQDTNKVYNHAGKHTNKVHMLMVSWSAFLVVNLAVNCTLSLQYSNQLLPRPFTKAQ